MNGFQRWLHRLYSGLLLPFLLGILWLLSWRDKKILESLQGRKGMWERLSAQLHQRRYDKPLIWFHVASAGEYLQAQPLIERLTKHGWQCGVTMTSITGFKWARKIPMNSAFHPLFIEFLPYDSAFNQRRMLALIQPSAIIFVKFDLWPNLIWLAYEQKVPLYMISATLQPKSLRWRKWGRWFYRQLYSCFNGIYTVSEADTARFKKCMTYAQRVRTYGDTRFDSVLDRKLRLPQPAIGEWIKSQFVMILGSVWPADEQVIYPALTNLLKEFTELILIIAPHEPTEEHLALPLKQFADFSVQRLSKLQNDSESRYRVLLVDTVGQLSSLYQLGRLAYVGGAFTTGVHNIMEPAIMGMPVIFGPIHYNAPEALDLVQRKLAFGIQGQEDFNTLVRDFLHEPERCATLGKQAAEAIVAQCGAADHCFHQIIREVQ